MSKPIEVDLSWEWGDAVYDDDILDAREARKWPADEPVQKGDAPGHDFHGNQYSQTAQPTQPALDTPPDATLEDVERFGRDVVHLTTYGEHYNRTVATHMSDARFMAERGRNREAGHWLQQAKDAVAYLGEQQVHKVHTWTDILKYRADQLRDHGRFADEGGGTATGALSVAIRRGLVGAAVRSGGLTLSTRTGSQPTSGNVVALQGHSRTFGARQPSAAELRKYYVDNALLLDQPNVHLGMWDDRKGSSGHFWLDLAEVHSSEAAARIHARQRGEIAYYSLDRNEEVRVR